MLVISFCDTYLYCTYFIFVLILPFYSLFGVGSGAKLVSIKFKVNVLTVLGTCQPAGIG